MIAKFNPSLILSREKNEQSTATVTRDQWIHADRLVMIMLILSVIITAILLS